MIARQRKALLYTKERRIGEGTYAVVYIGHYIPEGQKEKVKIAIKKIKLGAYKDGLDLSAIREVTALQELHQHPNIIQLIDVFSQKANLNLVLEFLEYDLEMVIKNKGIVFSSGDIKAWVAMALKGLRHCHALSILHRDMKPNNLLIRSDGVLKLADFGLAREFGDPDRKMTPTVVTRWYRAPELLLGATQYSTGIDIWAMGCIFAELMLRTPYLAGESDIAQLTTILRALGTPTEEDWPGLSSLPDYYSFPTYTRTPLKSLFTAAGPDALDLLERMLLYDPVKRPTAQECLDHHYFKGFPRPTRPEKLPKPAPVSRENDADGKKELSEMGESGVPDGQEDGHQKKRKRKTVNVDDSEYEYYETDSDPEESSTSIPRKLF